MDRDGRLRAVVAEQPSPLRFAPVSGAHRYGFPSPDCAYDRQFLADQAQQGRRIVGTRVVLTRLVDHPVDSRAGSFERAAFRAMTQAFEAAAVPGELS